MKRLREALGMTQQEFAHALGVGELAVSRWERGVSKPRLDLDQVVKLATMLLMAGLDVGHLLENKNT